MILLHKSLSATLHLLHVAIIIFCITGWLIPLTRPWHLLLCLMIFSSWFLLGIWKGWGYCLVTDIQWRLLQRMGRPVPPVGYMPALWQRITGQPVDARRVDLITQMTFYFCALASLWVNRPLLREWLTSTAW